MLDIIKSEKKLQLNVIAEGKGQSRKEVLGIANKIMICEDKNCGRTIAKMYRKVFF